MTIGYCISHIAITTALLWNSVCSKKIVRLNSVKHSGTSWCWERHHEDLCILWNQHPQKRKAECWHQRYMMVTLHSDLCIFFLHFVYGPGESLAVSTGFGQMVLESRDLLILGPPSSCFPQSKSFLITKLSGCCSCFYSAFPFNSTLLPMGLR